MAESVWVLQVFIGETPEEVIGVYSSKESALAMRKIIRDDPDMNATVAGRLCIEELPVLA